MMIPKAFASMMELLIYIFKSLPLLPRSFQQFCESVLSKRLAIMCDSSQIQLAVTVVANQGFSNRYSIPS